MKQKNDCAGHDETHEENQSVDAILRILKKRATDDAADTGDASTVEKKNGGGQADQGAASKREEKRVHGCGTR